MKKMIGLVIIIMVLAFSGNASAWYLHCNWENGDGTRAKHSRIDITGVQGNGLIQLQFDKYGPWVNPDKTYNSDGQVILKQVILSEYRGSESIVSNGMRDYSQAFATVSGFYVFIFHSRILDLGYAGVQYQSEVLCLEYRPDLRGFLLVDTWHTFYASLSGVNANEWYHATPNNVPDETIIYYLAE